MIRLKLPNHIQDMIQFRGLQIDHIRKAIRNPDFTETTYQGRILVRKDIDENRTIEVIYYREGFRDTNDYVIITAYYPSNE